MKQPAKDNFDNDPFAALHAPTGQGQVLSPNTQTQQQNLTTAKSGPPPRPESPSPALPPKKSKVPPPRPAPPRPLQVRMQQQIPGQDEKYIYLFNCHILIVLIVVKKCFPM